MQHRKPFGVFSFSPGSSNQTMSKLKRHFFLKHPEVSSTLRLNSGAQTLSWFSLHSFGEILEIFHTKLRLILKWSQKLWSMKRPHRSGRNSSLFSQKNGILLPDSILIETLHIHQLQASIFHLEPHILLIWHIFSQVWNWLQMMVCAVTVAATHKPGRYEEFRQFGFTL